jgi:hypothetical protein
MTYVSTDALDREIKVGDPVFYNAGIYRVTGFAADGKVKLNYLDRSRTIVDKSRWGSQMVIMSEADITFYFLRKKPDDKEIA